MRSWGQRSCNEIDALREQTCGHREGRREWDKQRVALKHIHCHKQNYIVSGNVLYDMGSANPALRDNLEGWDGVGGRREVQEGGDICVPMADPC